MTIWLLAGLIGLLAASGLFIGALVGYTERLPHRLTATVMGFGAGVLVAVLTLELVAESGERGSILATATGFMVGALLFSIGNWLLERRGAAERKRCGACVPQPSEAEIPGSGLAIAVGALIDGSLSPWPSVYQQQPSGGWTSEERIRASPLRLLPGSSWPTFHRGSQVLAECITPAGPVNTYWESGRWSWLRRPSHRFSARLHLKV